MTISRSNLHRPERAIRYAVLAVGAIAFSGCYFATKSDFNQLQQDMIGTRASTNAADSVQRAYLIEVARTVRTLSEMSWSSSMTRTRAFMRPPAGRR